jgi:hypothetical protein
MATPFLMLSALVLHLWASPRIPIPAAVQEGSGPLVLIVTPASLSPAFRALESWNEEQGCRTVVISIPDEDARRHPERILDSVRAVSVRAGVTGLLLGADQRLLPFPSPGDARPALVTSAWAGDTPSLAPLPAPPRDWLPLGLSVGRAEVGTLPEAWDFVESCRGTRETLDVLLLRVQLRAEGPRGLSSPLLGVRNPTTP